MAFEELVIAGIRTSDGERFFIGAQARGELLDEGSTGAAASPFPPPLDRSQLKALELAGIRPYTLMPESVLRAGLKELGLPQADIDERFAAARRLITTITDAPSQGGSH